MKYLGNPQSGSQAHTTASHNRAGQYLRNRRVPVVPTRTDKQGVLRGKFGSVSAAWQSLDTIAQNAWTSFAHGYPVVDALGQSIVLTGHQYFVGVNTSLLNAGTEMILTPPVNTTINPVTPVDAYVDAGGTFLVEFAPPAVDDFVLVGCSPVLSAGRSFNAQFSQFGVDAGAVGVVDIGEVYAAQYGTPIEGKVIFSRVRPVNSSGMSSNGVISKWSVAAASTLAAPSISSETTGKLTVTHSTADPADVLFYDGPTATGSWTIREFQASAASPTVNATAMTDLYGTARIRFGGVWSPTAQGILLAP